MDTKKDIQKSSTGIEGGRTSGESFGVSVSKKSDRLATALYLVTSFLSDIEPLKNRLRTLSLVLVREASYVRYGSTTTETTIFENLNANIIETLSLLELAFISGLMSEMNFTILKREYNLLHSKIEIRRSSRESRSDTILGDNFFNTPAPVFAKNISVFASEAKQSRVSELAQIPKGHSIGHIEVPMSDRNTKGHIHTPSVLEPRSGLARTREDPTFMHPSRTTTDIARESRHARILKLVKDKREVTIKDIATYFPELSEKTIQRELVGFVEAGVLKKSGERRWSRYALA
ncbi:MAG: DeoR family transcriptional regulator [Patescibacteria group bacterium]